MDQEAPVTDLHYVDILSELQDHGINDMVKLYSLPVELLALFGSVGRGSALRLHQYTRDYFLDPLGLLNIGGNTTRTKVIMVNDSSSTGGDTETASEKAAIIKVSSGTVDSEVTLCEREYSRLIHERRREILEWVYRVEGVCGKEEVEEEKEKGNNTDAMDTTDVASFLLYEV